MNDPEIEAEARVCLHHALVEAGLNEWRTLFVALRMVGLLMERTGCRVPIGVTGCQVIRDLAGAEEMGRVDAVRRMAFGMRRKAAGGAQSADGKGGAA